MSNKSIKPLAATIGAAVLATAFITSVSASTNPFQAQELNAGYDLANAGKEAEGKCGEGKCGDTKKADSEGKCGEGKCGDTKKADSEGKCGEGKCGG